MSMETFSFTEVTNRFSKQSNISHDGRVVGLTDNPADLHHWMVSGHEMARVIGEFEGSIQKKRDMDYLHLEQNKCAYWIGHE